MIVRKRQLNRVRFYIIGNLSLPDIISLFISCCVEVISLEDDAKFCENINSLSGIIFTTAGYKRNDEFRIFKVLLAIDRYIAVKYTLNYQIILTERKIILLLVFLWIMSLIIPRITSIVASSHDKYQCIYAIISLTFTWQCQFCC